MPRYIYKCYSCGEHKDIYHRMDERLKICDFCGEESLERLPSQLATPKIEKSKRVGSIVDSYIERAKEEIEQEKKNLKEREAK